MGDVDAVVEAAARAAVTAGSGFVAVDDAAAAAAVGGDAERGHVIGCR